MHSFWVSEYRQRMWPYDEGIHYWLHYTDCGVCEYILWVEVYGAGEYELILWRSLSMWIHSVSRSLLCRWITTDYDMQVSKYVKTDSVKGLWMKGHGVRENRSITMCRVSKHLNIYYEYTLMVRVDTGRLQYTGFRIRTQTGAKSLSWILVNTEWLKCAGFNVSEYRLWTRSIRTKWITQWETNCRFVFVQSMTLEWCLIRQLNYSKY